MTDEQNITNDAPNQGAQGNFFGTVIFNQPVRWLLVGGFTLATIMLVFGFVLTSRPSHTTVSGDQSAIVVGPVSGSQITQTINVGDPPEERSRFIAADVLYYMTNVDARLGLAQEVVLLNDIDREIESTRATISPALSEALGDQYRQLITTSHIDSLQSAWNTYPLTNEPGEALMSLLEGTGADPAEVRFFYEQLGEVQWASEMLLDTLETFANEAAPAAADDAERLEYDTERLLLAQETLQNRSTLAHLAGLDVLAALQVPDEVIEAEFGALQHLTPRALVAPAELEQRLTDATNQAAALIARRQELVDRGEALLQGDIDGYADLEDELTVQPDDTWDIVVAKAISLRQLGRTEDAVAAFGQYGQLFTAADPTAAPYAATAQAFTRQMDEVGVVDGAVYIFTLHANSPARAAGVQVGDIIVALDAQPVRSVSDYQDAIEGAASGVPVTLDVVRMQQGGTFQQLPITIDVPANTEAWPGLLGLGVMPI
jgi:hypothetical protein